MHERSPAIRAIIAAMFVVWIGLFVLAATGALPGF
jgi:low affinity Fe/Cu permease